MTEAMPVTRRLRRVAPLALVVVVVAACGDNDKGTATPKTPPSTTTASTAANPAPTGTGTKAGRKAKLVMGKRNLLPLLQSKISRFAPTQVEGKSLKVVALAGPESFWAGTSGAKRILVTMRLKGGSPPRSQSARRWTSSGS